MKTLTCPGLLPLLTVLALSACGDPGIPLTDPGVDVGGKQGAWWMVSNDDTMTVMIRGAAGEISRSSVRTTSGSFTLGSVSIDVEQLCARMDIVCPKDVFPPEIMLTQPQNDHHILFATYSRKGPLAAVSDSTLLGSMARAGTDMGLSFAIALGVGSAGQGACGLLGVSYATGKLRKGPLPEDPQREGGVAMQGTLVTSYTAGCIAGAQAGVEGLSVELQMGFRAERMGPPK